MKSKSKPVIPFFAQDPTDSEYWNRIFYNLWKGYVDKLLSYASETGHPLNYKQFRAFKDERKDYQVDAKAQAVDEKGEIVFQYKYSNYNSDPKSRSAQVRNLIADAKKGVEYKVMKKPTNLDEKEAKDIWKDVKYFVGVTNVSIDNIDAAKIKKDLKEASNSQFETDLLKAEDLASLAAHPIFLNLVISSTEKTIKYFEPIEKRLVYEKWDEEPKCFRDGFRPWGVDLGPVSPYFKCSKRTGVFIPQSWKKVLEELEGGKEIVWVIEPASTGKTTFGLWLGHCWRGTHQNWAVLYLDAKEMPSFLTSNGILRVLNDDITVARAFPLFIIFDNLQAWHEDAGWILDSLPIQNGTKLVYLSRPAKGIDKLKQAHEKKHGNKLIPFTISSKSYVKGVIRKYVQLTRKDLLNYPSLEEEMYKVFKHDLIACYYALQKVRLGESISLDLAAEGYWERFKPKLWENKDCPNQEDSLTALMVVAALYRFEIPTREHFIRNYFNVNQSILNWLVTDGWLGRDELSIDIEVPLSHLRFAHESSARVFVSMCKRFKDEFDSTLARFYSLEDEISWENAVLAEYKVKEDLDFNSLIFRGFEKELPKVLDDCTAYLKIKYPSEKEKLAELLIIRGSAARRLGGEENLKVAAKCFEEVKTLFGKELLLGKLRKGWLIYDIGMLKFHKNDPGALKEFQESFMLEREIGNEDKALMSEAQYWVVYARLSPSRVRLTTARENLLVIMERLQNEGEKLSSAGQALEMTKKINDIKRWVSSCQAHIAEMSVDLDDDQEVLSLLQKAGKIRVELGQPTLLPVLEFIQGKYFLRSDPKLALKLLEEALELFRIRERKERVTEVWIALGDAYKQLNILDKARCWYEKAKNHSGLHSNTVGKQLGEDRLKSITD